MGDRSPTQPPIFIGMGIFPLRSSGRIPVGRSVGCAVRRRVSVKIILDKFSLPLFGTVSFRLDFRKHNFAWDLLLKLMQNYDQSRRQ